MNELTGENEEHDQRTACVDDESVANVMSEIALEENENDLHMQIEQIIRLIETIETNKINALLNYPLYGMLLNELSSFKCLAAHSIFFEQKLNEYIGSLDELEEVLANGAIPDETSPFPITTLSTLIDEMRMQDDFTKKYKKELHQLLKILPNVKQTLEEIIKIVLGI